MVEEEEFDLSKFLTDTLSLEGNVAAPQRAMYYKSHENKLYKLFRQDPYEVLGEKEFFSQKPVPEDVVGTPIQEFYRGSHVLITGGTGFLGKILVEKLVRSVPHLGHVYILVRSKRGKSPQERFQLLLEDKVFSRMKGEVPHYLSKISVVEGDLSEPDLGLSTADRQILLDNVHVVFHSGADVRFLEPLRSAINNNMMGGKRVLDLAKGMKNLKSYVHVSTAYSQCVRRVVEEKVPRMNINYKEILNYVETMTDQQLEEETPRIMAGWPNTYTFSKAVCEDMLQEEAKGMPVCIYRPSIVVSTYKEPVKGWTDNLNGPLGMFLGAGLGVLHTFTLSPDIPIDIVPVDYVVNSMIAFAWSTGTRSEIKNVPVINFCLTSFKPTRWKTLLDIGVKYAQIWPFDEAIWYPFFVTFPSLTSFNIAHFFWHKIPGILLDKLSELCGKKPRLSKVFDKLYALKEQLHFFVCSIWEFENENIIALWRALSEEDKAIFNFDLCDVDLTELFMKGKLGLRYYLLKEKLEDLPAAVRKMKWLYWAHMTLKTVCGLAALKLMVLTAHALPI